MKILRKRRVELILKKVENNNKIWDFLKKVVINKATSLTEKQFKSTLAQIEAHNWEVWQLDMDANLKIELKWVPVTTHLFNVGWLGSECKVRVYKPTNP